MLKLIKISSLSLVFILHSCYCTYDITMNSDGSAHVEIMDWTDIDGELLDESAAGEDFYAEMDLFQNYPAVSNYQRVDSSGFFRISYDVSHIDSLHRYLWPFIEENPDAKQTKFNLENNQLTISHELEENGPNEVTMYAEFIDVKVLMNFEDKITSFNSDMEGVKQNNDHQIELNSNLRVLSYGKGTKTVEVTF